MKKIRITSQFFIDESKIQFIFIRSPGPGGQNVNKVATGVQLRFNINSPGELSAEIYNRLMVIGGNKISRTGDLIIKATRFRTQERNKHDALQRLITLLQQAATIPKHRKKTRPTKASNQNRLDKKKKHGKVKSLRGSKTNLHD